jgi:hypothetical protein
MSLGGPCMLEDLSYLPTLVFRKKRQLRILTRRAVQKIQRQPFSFFRAAKN